MKKRILSILLIAIMALTMLAGCGNSSDTSTKTSTAGTQATKEESTGTATTDAKETAEAASADGYTIGINCFGNGSYALVTLANNSVKVFEAYGDTASVSDDNFQIDKIIQDVENMIAAGVDGLIVWLPADTLYETVAELCEKNQVPFVLNDKIPADEEIAETIKANPYFVGAISPANDEYGTQMAEYALGKGYKTCIMSSSGVGDASDTPRLEAFREAFEAGGGEILEELHADAADAAHGQIENALIANPDVDFIYGVGSDFGIAACGVLENQGRTDIAVLTSGLDSEAVNLLESEQLEVLSGDNWIAGTMSAILMKNYLEGNELKDADGNVPYVTNIPPFTLQSNQIDLFRKCFIDNFCYTDEELNQLGGVSYDAFIEAIDNYSFEARAKALCEAGVVTEDELSAAGIN